MPPDLEEVTTHETKDDAPVSGRNQSAIDRRNAIADAADELRARKDDLRDVSDDGREILDTFNGETPEQREERELAEQAAAERALQEQSEQAARELQEEGVKTGKEKIDKTKVDPEPDPDSKIVDGVTYYKLVVNGKTKWLNHQQLRATASKVESADEYLKVAKETVTTSARAAIPSATDEPVKVDDDDLEKVLDSALLGDEEAKKKLAQRLKSVTAKPSLTPDVLHAVDEHLSRRRSSEDFARSFKERHKDIFDDPDSASLFHDLDTASAKRAQDEGIEIALAERLEQVAARVKKVRGVTSKDDKLARKQAARQVPTAAGRQAERLDEDADEPPEAVIAQMAKARGGRVIRH